MPWQRDGRWWVAIAMGFVVKTSGVVVRQRVPQQTVWPLRCPLQPDVTEIGDLVVPYLGLGTIAWTPERESFLPGDNLDSKANTADKQRRLSQLALEEGCYFFDTAERYSVGTGERLLADALRGGSRPPVIASKFTPTPWRTDAASVVDACRASRERLGVDTIDLYQIHMPDIVQPFRVVGYVDNKDRAYWEGLARCVELGLVKEVGVSNYGPSRLAECHAFLADRGVRLASNQIHYSLLARRAGNQAAVDAAKKLGVRTLAYYPLAMGLLSASARDRRTGPLAHYAQGGVGYIGAPWLDKNRVVVPEGGVLPLVDALAAVGAKYKKTASQVALNWIMCQDVIPVVGATTDAYLLDAVGAMGWRLSAADSTFLETTADNLGFEFQGTYFKRVDSKFVGYGIESWALD